MSASTPSRPRDGHSIDAQVPDEHASGATQRQPVLTENLADLAKKAFAEGGVIELPGPLDWPPHGGRGDGAAAVVERRAGGSLDVLGRADWAGDLLLRAASRGHGYAHQPLLRAPRCPGHETAEGELDFSLSTSAGGEPFFVNGDYSASCPVCMVCQAVLRRLMGNAVLGRPGPAARTFAHLARNKLELTYGSYGSDSGASSLFLDVYKFPGLPCPLPLREHYDVAPDANAEQCWDFARRCLSICREEHPGCVLVHPSTPALPTRVVDLAGPVPKLFLTNGLHGTYTALSYCWGQSPVLKTTLARVSPFQDEIPISSLPATIKDSFEVARKLGYQYIWVDSLCIIQDDKADWEQESCKMATIYGDADLVIGATSASHANEGFLVPRPPHPRGVAFFHPRGQPETLYGVKYGPVTEHHKAWNFDDQGPLALRAWAMQEKLLARRYLSFDARELFWRCHTRTTCECCFPGPCGDWHAPRIQAHGGSLLAMRDRGQLLPPGMTRAAMYHKWTDTIVPRYTSRLLTKPADRLHAMAAIVSVFENRLQDVCLYGLFRQQLLQQLAWVRCMPQGRHYRYNPESAGAGADTPTWSWASILGPVLFFTPGEANCQAHLLRLCSRPGLVATDRPSRALRLRGRLVRTLVTMLQAPSNDRTATWLSLAVSRRVSPLLFAAESVRQATPTSIPSAFQWCRFNEVNSTAEGAMSGPEGPDGISLMFHLDAEPKVTTTGPEIGPPQPTTLRNFETNPEGTCQTAQKGEPMPMWCLVYSSQRYPGLPDEPARDSGKSGFLVLGRSLRFPGTFERLGMAFVHWRGQTQHGRLASYLRTVPERDIELV